MPSALPKSIGAGKALENMPEGKSDPGSLAIVCNTTRCGGVYRVASTLCNAWSRQGRKVFLIALYGYQSFFHLETSVQRVDAVAAQETNWIARARRKAENLLARLLTGLTYFRRIRPSDGLLLNAGSLWLAHRIRPLRAAIQQTNPSVVIAFGWQANIITILACRNLGCKVIISERNDVANRPLEAPWEDFRTGLYNRADIVTANTVGALKTMQAYVDPDKLVFVPNPIERHESVVTTPRPTSPLILVVGNLDRLKAHDILLQAFARLAPALSNWRLAIVGGGDEEKALHEQVRILGIADRVDWHGRVANPFVFYHAASIFVLPSRSEGMPNAVMEAMSCGLPVVVTSASPGPLDLVKDGETGLVVQAGHPDALARAIELLAGNPTLRRRLGDAARKRISEYELSNVMPIWERLTATDPAAGSRSTES